MPRWLEALWYDAHPLYRALLPLSWLFAGVAAVRRGLYRRGWLASQRLPVPVIVVGNISVGGVGKTPVVLDLLRRLKAGGWSPGVVSRGYGSGVRQATPVLPNSDPAAVGDEPVLIAAESGCPVVVDPVRARAARLLMAQGVNIIVADDGLQHYALQRDIEIAVLDGGRRHGNGHLLPAGPLRERPQRLADIDLVLVNGSARTDEHKLIEELGPARHLLGGQIRSLGDFEEVHAVAGIGKPEKFFASLEAAGLRIRRHAYPDHHPYTPQDLKFSGKLPLLMTTKDAVKCQRFAEADWWAVEHHLRLPEAAWQELCSRLQLCSRLPMPDQEKEHG